MSESDTPVMTPDMFYQAEPEPVDTSITPTDEAPTKEPEQVEEVEPVETEVLEGEAEETELESEESEPELNDDEQFFQMDGEDISLEQVKQWKQGDMRQSDYTKKTQKLADERRVFEADRQGEVNKVVAEKLNSFDDLTDTLEALIKQADEAIDWDDLREFDIGEYTKQKELKEKRIKTVDDAKLKRLEQSKIKQSPEDEKREQAILAKNNPAWVKDGKNTEAHKKDMKLLSNYLTNNGYTVEEQKEIVTAKRWQTLIDAARYRASLDKVRDIKTKVKKIPLTTKPRKTAPKSNGSFADRFYNS